MAIYSCADPLLSLDGELAETALELAIERGNAVGAEIIKFSIEGGANAAVAHIQKLSYRLQSVDIPVLIENDQSNAAGSIFQIKRVFLKASGRGIELGMTFDIGNWHWVGEGPQEAASVFADRIRYVHTKGVHKQASRWMAFPLADSQAPWKTLLDAMPDQYPWAVEFPLVDDDLVAVTRNEIARLKQMSGERYVN